MTALEMEERDISSRGILRFRKIAKAVQIFTSWLHWLAKLLKLPVDKSWKALVPLDKLMNPHVVTNTSTFSYSKLLQEKQKYSGWVTEEVRALLRVPSNERTEQELDIIYEVFSSLKCLQKYDETGRKAILRYGRYDKWNTNRTIVKQGHPGHNFYIILEGDVSLSKIDRTSIEAAIEKNPNMDKKRLQELEQACKNFECFSYKLMVSQDVMEVGKLRSGDMFGELIISYTNEIKYRAVTITTLKSTEFLVIDANQVKGFLKVKSDQSQKRKLDIMAQIPLLKTLRIDFNTLAYYCTVKTISLDITMLVEGQDHENIYFINQGTCRMLKLVQVIKCKNGSYNIQPLDGDKSMVSESNLFCEYHLISVGQNLIQGDYFGESIIPDAIKEMTWATGVGIKYSPLSIVSSTRMELLVVPKVHLNRFATNDTWDYFIKTRKTFQLQELQTGYQRSLLWNEKRDLVLHEISKSA